MKQLLHEATVADFNQQNVGLANCGISDGHTQAAHLWLLYKSLHMCGVIHDHHSIFARILYLQMQHDLC